VTRVGGPGYDGRMSTIAPDTLPPHLEQAPALSTEPQAPPAPKAHRLRPVHLAVLNEAGARAREIVSQAQRLVAEDLGVSGPFRLEDHPGGPVLVEQSS